MLIHWMPLARPEDHHFNPLHVLEFCFLWARHQEPASMFSLYNRDILPRKGSKGVKPVRHAKLFYKLPQAGVPPQTVL